MDKNVFDQLVELKKQRLGIAKPATAPVASKPTTRIRTVGNLDTIVESQRIYNPKLPPTNPNMPTNSTSAPPTPATKGPPAKMVHTGTAGSSDLEGSWGTPEEKK